MSRHIYPLLAPSERHFGASLRALLAVGIARPSVPLTSCNGSVEPSPTPGPLAAAGLNSDNMAPIRKDAHGDQCGGIKPDRKVGACVSHFTLVLSGCRLGSQSDSLLWQTRKPLVEKKRRARINESLQELRLLIADTDVRFPNLTKHISFKISGVCSVFLRKFLGFFVIHCSCNQRWRTPKCWR